MIYKSNEEEIVLDIKNNRSWRGWLSGCQFPQEDPPEGLDGDLTEDGPKEVEDLGVHGETRLIQSKLTGARIGPS